MRFIDRVFPWNSTPFHLDWLQVEVSALCNSSCSYCPTNCYRGRRQGGLMEMQTFERLRPSFPDCGLVFLQGWGEPLLHPEFWAMVRETKRSGAVTGFTTNATLLDRECRLQLVEAGVDIMAVSLAGASAGTQSRFREGCSLEQIDEALTGLGELKRQRGARKPSVHIAFILLSSNWREVGGLIDLAARWGVSEIVISDLSWIATEAEREESLVERPELWPEVVAEVEKARRDGSEKGVQVHYQGPGSGAPRAMCTENPLNACYVSYRGDVSPCPFTSLGVSPGEGAEHYFQGRVHGIEPLVFGNVRERTLPEILESELARTFRKSFRRRQAMDSPGTEHLQGQCSHCYKLL